MSDNVKVGDRWVYTTPMGRERPCVVRCVDVEPKFRAPDDKHRYVRLESEDGRAPDAVMREGDLFAVDYWEPV